MNWKDDNPNRPSDAIVSRIDIRHTSHIKYAALEDYADHRPEASIQHVLKHPNRQGFRASLFTNGSSQNSQVFATYEDACLCLDKMVADWISRIEAIKTRINKVLQD